MSHQTKHEYTEIPVTDSEEISSDHKKTTFSLLVLVLVIIATSIVSSSITLLVTQTTSPPVKTNFKPVATRVEKQRHWAVHLTPLPSLGYQKTVLET